MIAALILAIVLPMLLAAAFLLGRHWHRRAVESDELSPVSRQHIDLFQGGLLNEAAVEAAKSRLRHLLEQGEVAAVEASLRPGTNYVFHVRALADIGTDEAGRILERQLQRRLSDDQLEQSWYWIDLAHGLRMLNRAESLPHLLRCGNEASQVPLGHFFAAETVCFLGFVGYLRQPEAPSGAAAMRLLHRALEGLRFGVRADMVVEGRLGEVIDTLWDHRPARVHPLLVRVLAEALRLLRRVPHAKMFLADDGAEPEALDWQISRLAALEPAWAEYLREAPAALAAQLEQATTELDDLLRALDDLRAEAAPQIMRLLDRPKCPHADLAVAVLTWSKGSDVGPWLREWISRRVSPGKRARLQRQVASSPRSALPPHVPYQAVLRALRGHPSPETEGFLLVAARDPDPGIRAAALSSLGWWEPLQPIEVVAGLQKSRFDPSTEVRQSARAALGRLGERQALQWFRQALTAENMHQVHEAIQVIAGECLTLLWPDLDRLADADEPEVAMHAREALERLAEEMEWRRGAE